MRDSNQEDGGLTARVPMGIPISLVLQQLPESELKMPPNVRNVNDVGTGVSSWYFDQPPITRTYATCIVVATLLSFVLQILQLSHIALLWPSVYKKFEIWRLVRCPMHGRIPSLITMHDIPIR